jgi:ankyrin repeat protein
MENQFINLCDKFIDISHSSLEEVKKFLEDNPTFDISEFDEYSFRWVCEHGNLEVAKWLLETKPDINISEHNEEAFRNACRFGHLEVAKWLLQVKPDINISAENEYAFRWACGYGRLDVVKWLLEVKPDLDITAGGKESAFLNICRYGKLEVAQWLLEIKPDLDISANNEEIFRLAYDYSHLELLRWLQSLYPEKYHLQIVDNRIHSYKIIVDNKIISRGDKHISKKNASNASINGPLIVHYKKMLRFMPEEARKKMMYGF